MVLESFLACLRHFQFLTLTDHFAKAKAFPKFSHFFWEKVRAKYIFYFKLLRDSPIDQIVQTVFGYSLRKE